MSIVQGQPPPYSEAQVISSLPVPVVSDSSLLTLASASSRSAETGMKEDTEPSTEDNENLESLKTNIYRHTLFPLLAMVFNKCETATFSPDATSLNFEDELKAFMKHQEGLKTPLLEEEEEVNQLMLKAIQVLRIHLMEVEKVNDLCKDFCARYIACLKGKLTSESLLHVEGCDSPPPADLSPNQSVLTLSPSIQVQAPPVTPTVVGGNMLLQQQQQQQQQQQPQIVSGNTVYQMVHTPQGIVAQPIQIQGPLTPLTQNTQQAIHGSTPLSQVGLSVTSTPQAPQPPQQQQAVSQQQNQHPLHTPPDMKPLCVPSTSEDPEEDDKNGKQKRGVLPKQATQIMKSWLFQHIVHPYPTEDEKRQIASQTNLTLLQVNNWFINARRRILQPMLEASNPDKAKPKKANKPTNRPQQRFWPIQADASSSDGEQFIKAEKENEGQHLENRPVTPSKQAADRLAQTAAMDAAGAMASSEALLGLVQNGGLVLKLSPDGQLIPSAPVSTPNPAAITLENLHALQSSGLLFAPGASPLPLHLPFNGLSPSAGLGLGMNPFPSLAAAASIMNFNPSAYAPLQFANINTTPIDLSTMSNSNAIQLNALAGAAANAHISGTSNLYSPQ